MKVILEKLSSVSETTVQGVAKERQNMCGISSDRNIQKNREKRQERRDERKGEFNRRTV